MAENSACPVTIRAVVFDFDGVLAETLPSHYAAWREVLADVNLSPTDMTIRLNEGQPTYKIAQALFSEKGIVLSEERARSFAEKKNSIFQSNNRARPYPGMHELLRQLKPHLKIGLCSGTTWENIQSVLSAEMLDFFDAIVTDGDFERPKPDPEPYVVAARKLGLAPEGCLAVENAPLGIRAAKSAHMTCIGLASTLEPEFLAGADRLCASHEELLQAIKSITGTSCRTPDGPLPKTTESEWPG